MKFNIRKTHLKKKRLLSQMNVPYEVHYQRGLLSKMLVSKKENKHYMLPPHLPWIYMGTSEIQLLIQHFKTLYSIDTHFDTESFRKTSWEKKKLLVTSDFSFHNNVFYSIR